MSRVWHRRIVPLVVVGAVALAACGGGRDARQVLTAGAEPRSTEAVPDAVESTDVAVTSEVEVSGTDGPAAGSTPPPPGADDDRMRRAFCGAGERLLAQAAAIEIVGLDDASTARSLFERVEFSTAAVLLNAPDATVLDDLRRVEEARRRVVPELEAIDFDGTRLGEADDGNAVNAALGEFAGVTDEIATVFENRCGTDPARVDDEARALLDVLRSGDPTAPATTAVTPPSPPPSPQSVPDPADPGVVVDLVGVSDDSGTISIDVPTSWSDVDGAADGEFRQLIVAPDITTFFSSYDRPGLFALSTETSPGDGGIAGSGGFAGFEETLDRDGCVREDSSAFQGDYAGEQAVYRCSDAPVLVHIAGGTNEAEDLFWLVLTVVPDDRPTIWPAMADSLVVD